MSQSQVMNTVSIISTQITSNIMIKEELDTKAKRYLPKSFDELIEFAEANPETFNSKIDVNVLRIDSNTKINVTDTLFGNMDVIPVAYNQINSVNQWEIYSIMFTHSDQGEIYVPGTCIVPAVDEKGIVSFKQVKELTTQDKIICKILGNVIFPQEVFEIKLAGKYKITEYINLEVPEDTFIPIGNSFIQVFIK